MTRALPSTLGHSLGHFGPFGAGLGAYTRENEVVAGFHKTVRGASFRAESGAPAGSQRAEPKGPLTAWFPEGLARKGGDAWCTQAAASGARCSLAGARVISGRPPGRARDGGPARATYFPAVG